ncbi:MAG TPA: dienelactone hydrolase family protein [Gemmatimonadaceae bacterium]|nr:dienelactone hydrolase family protein [Gemmatimonadaceae bacterium]
MSEARAAGCTVVLFHSALGLRPAVRDFADRLRAAGHTAHTPDLYDGELFDDLPSGMKKVEALGGISALMQRTQAAVADLPTDVVYAGFSNGGASAEMLAATRPGARGAVLMHAALPLQAFGAESWPRTVPVQIHYADRDPLRDQKNVDALAASVRQSGARLELYDYRADGHLFADADSPDYDRAAAELMTRRVLDFLERVSA